MDKDTQDWHDFLTVAHIPLDMHNSIAKAFLEEAISVGMLKDHCANGTTIGKAVNFVNATLKSVRMEKAEPLDQDAQERISVAIINDAKPQVPSLDEILSTTTWPPIRADTKNISASSSIFTDSMNYAEMPSSSSVVSWIDFISQAAMFRRAPNTNRYQVTFKIDGSLEAQCEKRVETCVTVLLDKLQLIYLKEINPNLSHRQTTISDLSIRIGDKLVGYIEVRTPWKFLTTGDNILDAYHNELQALLDDKVKKGEKVSTNKEFGTYWGVRQLLGNLFEKGLKYGIITTFNHWCFMKIEDGGVVHISPAISCHQLDAIETPGLLRCILYFLDLLNGPIVSARSSLITAAILVTGNGRRRSTRRTSSQHHVNPSSTLHQTASVSSKRKRSQSSETRSKTGQEKTSSNTTRLTIKSEFLSKLLGTGLTCRVYLYTGGYTHSVDNTFYPEIALKFVDVGKDHSFKAMALTELSVYDRLVDLQGRVIPRILFYASCFPFFLIGMTVVKGAEPISATTPDPEEKMRQLADALNEINTRGVCHNDLRSDNILIDQENKLWLIDFSHSYCFSDPNSNASVEKIPSEIFELDQ